MISPMQMETEMIDKLDVYISGGMGDAKYRSLLHVMYAPLLPLPPSLPPLSLSPLSLSLSLPLSLSLSLPISPPLSPSLSLSFPSDFFCSQLLFPFLSSTFFSLPSPSLSPSHPARLADRCRANPQMEKEGGMAFIESLVELLRRLLDYRAVKQGDEYRDLHMHVMFNLLNFYKEMGREEIYIRLVTMAMVGYHDSRWHWFMGRVRLILPMTQYTQCASNLLLPSSLSPLPPSLPPSLLQVHLPPGRATQAEWELGGGGQHSPAAR